MDAEAARRLIAYLAVGATFLLTGRYDIFAAAAAFWSVRAAAPGSVVGRLDVELCRLSPQALPGRLLARFLDRRMAAHGPHPAAASRLDGRVGRSYWSGSPPFSTVTTALNAVHYYLRRPTEIGEHSRRPVAAGRLAPASGPQLPQRQRGERRRATHRRWPSRSWPPLGMPVGAGGPSSGTASRSRPPAWPLSPWSSSGGKVLSAQYLIWLMPLWALYPIRPIWLLAALANVVVFPYERVGAERHAAAHPRLRRQP